MLCKRCMVVMAPGTTYYEKKKGEDDKKGIKHRRFCECPKCKERIYNNSTNFQEIMEQVIKKK